MFTPAALTGLPRRIGELKLVRPTRRAAIKRAPSTLAVLASERGMKLFSMALEETMTLFAVNLKAVKFLITGLPRRFVGATV